MTSPMVACPSCGTPLPLNRVLERCPQCSLRLDAAAVPALPETASGTTPAGLLQRIRLHAAELHDGPDADAYDAHERACRELEVLLRHSNLL